MCAFVGNASKCCFHKMPLIGKHSLAIFVDKEKLNAMADRVTLKWKSGMAFEGEVNGHTLAIDADEKVGGTDSGPRPKALMLLALAGCTAMDVVSILGKMRMPYDDFTVDVVSNKTSDHPVVYTDFRIIYKFRGKELDLEKIQKAIDLSQEKYCGVSAMYRHIGPVTFEVVTEE